MIAVDTSVWIHYLRNDDVPVVRVLNQRAHVEELVVGDLVLTEVLQGISDPRVASVAQERLERCLNPTLVGRTNALAAAALYRRLRSAGVTVRKTPDLWIATWCIANHVPLLHRDRDFTAIARHEPRLVEVPVPVI